MVEALHLLMQLHAMPFPEHLFYFLLQVFPVKPLYAVRFLNFLFQHGEYMLVFLNRHLYVIHLLFFFK